MPRNRGALENKTGKYKNGLSFGTWNIGTLFKPGAVQCLVEKTKRYKLRVVALQEIRWNDKGPLDIQNTAFDRRKEARTQLLIDPTNREKVMVFK